MAPKRVLDRSSADNSSQSSVSPGGHLSHLPSSSHTITKKQPIVRIVQIRPPKLIKTDLASFRDIVHRFTGHQAEIDHQNEEVGTTQSKQQKAEELSISKSSSVTSLATSPSSAASPSSPSSSSSPSSASSADTFCTKSTTSNDIHIDGCFPEGNFQEYGSLLASWECIVNDDSTSKFLNREESTASMISNGMEGIYSALDPITPFDHMFEFNKMSLNYY